MLCRGIGLGAVTLFLLVAGIIAFTYEEDTRPFLFKLLDQRKYPASQLYLLMTLGPLIALIPASERLTGRISEAISVFGRVPFFYYLLHIFVIHISALIVNTVMTGDTHSQLYFQAPFVFFENENDRWSLGLLYVVFIVDVIVLYFPCRWYAAYKARSTQRWTKYL